MPDPGIRYGLRLPPMGVRDNLELAKYADRLGVDSSWVIETRLTADAVTPLSAYAAVTERMRMGTAVIPLWTRNPALIAQTFATLDANAPGRIILGIGAWWEPLATQVGVKRERAIRAMREVVEAVRLLLKRDAPVTYLGDYVHLDNVFLDHDGGGGHDVKIYVAAVGPQMLRLAGRIADGVILNSNHTVGATRRAVEEIRKGAESAGRSMDSIERVKPLPLRVDRDRQAALDFDKPRIAQYIAQQPHVEGPTEVDPELAARLKETIPFPATQAQVMEGAKLISNELVESLGCYGDVEEVLSKAGEFRDAGMTLPITEADRALVDALAGVS